MNIGGLVQQIQRNKPTLKKPITTVSNIETSKGVFYNAENLYGQDSAEFYILLINLFDKALVDNDLHLLSLEQERLLSQFFEEANTITRQHTSASEQTYISEEDKFLHDIWSVIDYNFVLDLDFQNKYNNREYERLYNRLDRTIQRLDDYLGSYIGEEDGRYARYGKKQFYSQREPFGQTIEIVGGA